MKKQQITGAPTERDDDNDDENVDDDDDVDARSRSTCCYRTKRLRNRLVHILESSKTVIVNPLWTLIQAFKTTAATNVVHAVPEFFLNSGIRFGSMYERKTETRQLHRELHW